MPGADVAVVGLSASAAKMPILVEKLRAHSLTPQQAWEAGDLDVPDLIYFLESLDRWGGFYWEIDLDLRRQVVALLVQHGQKQLQQPEKLSPAVRLWLADYYGSINAPECLALCESILREQKEPKKGEDALTFQALERMAWFYRDQGQHEKEAEIWLRVPTSIPDPGWWQSDALIEAARAYSKAGKSEEARRLYVQVPKFGDGWHTAMSYYDQALPLLDAGKLDEAKAILSKELQAKENSEIGLIAQNAWLASLAYRQGKLDEAMRHGQIVTQLGEKTQLPNASVKSLCTLGRDIYNRAGGWKTQPIQSDVKELIIKTNPSQPDQPLYARFQIKTYGAQTVIAIVDNPAIQARVLPIDKWQKSGLEAQEEKKEVVLELHRKSQNIKTLKFVLLLKNGTHEFQKEPVETKINVRIQD